MSSPLRILVDLNVWLDSYIPTRPHAEESLAFLTAATSSDALLLYGASKLETAFYLIRSATKTMIHSARDALTEADAEFATRYAWGCLENIREMATAVGMDEADLWYACKCRAIGNDFEDNVLLANAKRAQADYLVTWDETLMRRAGAVVKAVTPPVMSTILQEGL